MRFCWRVEGRSVFFCNILPAVRFMWRNETRAGGRAPRYVPRCVPLPDEIANSGNFIPDKLCYSTALEDAPDLRVVLWVSARGFCTHTAYRTRAVWLEERMRVIGDDRIAVCRRAYTSRHGAD